MNRVITITDPAAKFINQILTKNFGKSLKVGYAKRGCSGYKYTFDLVTTTDINKFDEIIELDQGKLVIAAEHVMGLIGSVLDLEQSVLDQYLVWKNPSATNHCGCGESFQISKEKCSL